MGREKKNHIKMGERKAKTKTVSWTLLARSLAWRLYAQGMRGSGVTVYLLLSYSAFSDMLGKIQDMVNEISVALVLLVSKFHVFILFFRCRPSMSGQDVV